MIQSPYVTLWKRPAKRVKLRLSRGFSQFFKTTQSAVIEKPGVVNPEVNIYLSMAGPSITETLEIIGIYIMYVYNACVNV